MDPNVAVILGALVAGVAETATQAVKDGYAALKRLLTRKFADDQKAKEILADHAQDPTTYELPMAKHLETSGAAADPQIIQAAEQVKASAVAANMSIKYFSNVYGGRNAIGDGATYNEYRADTA